MIQGLSTATSRVEHPSAAPQANPWKHVLQDTEEDPMNCSCLDDGGAVDPVLSDADKDTLRRGKIGVILGTFFLTLGASVLPWIISRYLAHAVYWLTLGASAAAGIILGAFLSHLTPDSNEAFAEYFALNGPVGLVRAQDVDYPFAQLLIGVCVVALIMVDAIVVSRGIGGHSHGPAIDDGHGHGHGHGPYGSAPQASPASRGHSHIIPELPANYGHDFADATKGSAPTVAATSSKPGISLNTIDDGSAVPDGPGLSPANGTRPAANALDAARGSRKQIAQAYLFFAALSLHSVFDGLSVGSEQNVSGFYSLLVAVMSHKMFDGFALGVPIFFAKLPTFHTVFSLVFTSAMTPLGTAIGWAATEDTQGASAQLAKAIILSLSAGSFLFISLIELLPAALGDGRHVFTKCIMFLLGWGVMALIALWV